MKMNCPPPQVMRVGFEPNQQGQAALNEHASSSWPTIFQGVFGASVLVASAARATRAAPARAITANDRNRVLRVMRGSLLVRMAGRSGRCWPCGCMSYHDSLQDVIIIHEQVGLPQRGAASARTESQAPVAAVHEGDHARARILDAHGPGGTGAAVGARHPFDQALDQGPGAGRVADAPDRPRLADRLETLAAPFRAVRVRLDENVDVAARAHQPALSISRR